MPRQGRPLFHRPHPALHGHVGRKTLLLIPVIAVLLGGGWFALRRRISEAADRDLTEVTEVTEVTELTELTK